MLINYGVDRILTRLRGHSGELGGEETLKALVKAADGRIEIVIGGSVSPVNAKEIVSSLGQFSGSAASCPLGVQENRVTAKSGPALSKLRIDRGGVRYRR